LVVAPSLAKSIVMLSGRVADTLVKDGHDVTFWIPDMFPGATVNGTMLAQRIIRMSNLSDAFARFVEQERGDHFREEGIWQKLHNKLYEELSIAEWCESILIRKAELEVLRELNFDLAFTDQIDLCMVGLMHHLGIPRQVLISTGHLSDAVRWHMGIPTPLSYVPAMQENLLGPVMDFGERMLNVFMYVAGGYTLHRQHSAETEAFRKLISPDFPPNHDHITAMITRQSLVFFAGDEFINPAAPTLAKVKYIGGIGLEKPKKLPEKLLRLVEAGKDGAVLFSLGTATRTDLLDREKLSSIYISFKSFPNLQFIVKISVGDEWSKNFTEDIDNVAVLDWFPQSDLLAHPHMKLFISHGGYNSILESAIRGVPMVVIPLFFDQFRDAKAAEYRGYARIVQKKEINLPNMEAVITEVLINPAYKEAAERLAKLYRTKPNQPAKTLLEWTRFVLVNGELPELVPEGAKLGLIQHYCLDVILITVAGILMVIYSVISLFRLAICKIGGQKFKSKVN